MTGEDNKPTVKGTKETKKEADAKSGVESNRADLVSNAPANASAEPPTSATINADTTTLVTKKVVGADSNATLNTSAANPNTSSKNPDMSNKKSNVSNAIDSATSQTVDSAKSAKTPRTTPKTSKLNSATLMLLLLLIIGLAASAFYGLKFWQTYTATQEQRFAVLESKNSEQLLKINAISQKQSNKSSDQSEFLSAIKKDQDALQTQINQRLDSHTQRLRALAGTSRSDWLLAEARYLLRLASQRLLVENSTVGAQALLQSADDILLSIDDPELLPARSAIAAEMIALRLAKAVDRPGIYLQLSALKSQIQALPLIPFRPQSKFTKVEVAVADDVSTQWYTRILTSLKSVLNELKGFVQIRQHDQAPDLLISEQQQLQIINNLMLMLEQAQYSLLHEEELIYQASLEKAKKWWKSYYSHYSEYEVVNHELNKLLNKDVTQVIPVINRSNKLLTDYIDRFHKLNGESKSAASNAMPTPTKPVAPVQSPGPVL
ncbi:MAG: uroporphyrin-3 C-methyltransferase [Pseudohongiellaceae bacterium]|jgi:uroporphyrin-3 C-methyltransferase